ncbi:serpin family protein [Glycomyces xiaoerkulensis]|uniref:serpin family protein n=1 Tax=Glycomyces xiaoerkulensis TaxID=2038139 RepID=UPI000C255F1E|nr:serpin family protein [Glycomyces xiaoerkulensis]
MSSSNGKTTLEQALRAAEIEAANELTRRWLTSREEVPAAASALGVWPLLTALACGATGLTREELLTAAGVDADRAEEVAAALIGAAGAASGIRLALGVWAGSRLALDPDWTAALPAEAVGSLTGEAEADKAELDAWASRNTDGMIDRMPVDLGDKVDLLLAGALLVDTAWVTEFRDLPRRFRSGPWADLGQCRALEATVFDDVLRVTDEASVLTVPGRDDIDVLLALGRDDLSPHQVLSSAVDAAGDPDWGRSAATELAVGERAPGVAVTEYRHHEPQQGPEVAVEAVRFSVAADLDLFEDAAALGLVRASDEDSADFERLAAQRTYVSQARQACTAVFSATGFKAAAVTTVAMALAGAAVPPKARHRRVRATFGIDRPFAYLARHRPSGLILVAGWVDEPELED